MRRTINIIKNIKVTPTYMFKGNDDDSVDKNKSDLEKPKKKKPDKDDKHLKYFIHL